MRRINALLALVLAVLVAAPSWAAPTKLKNNFKVTGNLTVDGTSTLTGATTQTGNFTVGGNLSVTGTTTLTGVATGTAANVLTHAATSGLRILDTGADHRISINATSNEAADRAISVPALGGNKTLSFIDLAETISAAKSYTAAQTFDDGSLVAKAGTSTETLKPSGLIDSKITTTSTAADTTETDGYSFSVPANTLNGNGKALRMKVWGTTANTANNKTVKLYWNGVAVFTSGTTSQNKDWVFEMLVIRDGASTQRIVVDGVYNDAVVVPVTTTGTGTDTGAIVIKSTMTNGTAAAADISTEGATLEFLSL